MEGGGGFVSGGQVRQSCSIVGVMLVGGGQVGRRRAGWSAADRLVSGGQVGEPRAGW
jgi:hypothetical protein